VARLIGRTLFAFFGGSRPAIRQLGLSLIYDQLPDDILECWATAFWACQACLLAANSHSKLRQNLLPIFTSLSERVYRLTGLNREELEAMQIISVLDRLSARFGARLGLEPELIRRSHLRTTQNLNATRATA
jgi:hypothetical protein